MLIWFALAGVATAWMILMPPESISGRLRAGLVALGVLVTLGSGWATWASIEAMNQARKNALAAKRRHDAYVRDAILRLEEEARSEPFGPGP
jgi:hypothetical protein